MSEDFLIWGTRYVAGWCVVAKPEPYEDLFELDYGVPLTTKWPPASTCRMKDQYPKDIQLADSVNCPYARLVSNRLRQELDAVGVAGIEYLPLAIINHKGRIAARNYWLVNPPGTLDCIDLEASNATWDGKPDESFTGCDALVLRTDVIPERTLLFRPRFKPELIIVRRVLAEHLQVCGFTGLEFDALSEYTGLF